MSKPTEKEIITNDQEVKESKKIPIAQKKQITETTKQTGPLEIATKNDPQSNKSTPGQEEEGKKTSDMGKINNSGITILPNNETENKKENIKRNSEVIIEKQSSPPEITKDKQCTEEQPIETLEKQEHKEKEEVKSLTRKEEKSEIKKVDTNEPTGKVLNLEVVESPSFTCGTILVINPEGFVGSKRNAKDGRTFFGSYDGTDPTQMNDIIVNSEERGIGLKHFVIEYNTEKNNYYLNNLGQGSGTFIRIVTKFALTTNLVLSFSNLHFSLMVQDIISSDKVQSQLGL